MTEFSTVPVATPLTREQLRWVLTLAQQAGWLPLEPESRSLNLRVWEACCDAYTGAGEPAPVPARGALRWDEVAGVFLREASGAGGEH